jgi:hypothetical protein
VGFRVKYSERGIQPVEGTRSTDAARKTSSFWS